MSKQSQLEKRDSTRSKYKKIDQIGCGSYGKVFTVRDQHDEQIYVSKKIDLSFLDVN